eukprot:128355_1
MQTQQVEKQRLLNQNNLCNKRAQSINSEGQNELDIAGIKVLFPFEPYDCQLIYMQKVIETLQTGTTALLESPTGTGKTLSLLCSVLAWTNHLKTDYQKLKEFEMAGNSLHKNIGVPNIIYSTRTHTQLNQCVQELKTTAYHPRIAILGSREQLCVHPKVSKEKGSKQNTKCRSINAPSSAHKCWFKLGSKNMSGVTKAVLSNHILDVEDLHLIGKDQGFCPYYHSIENCVDADIIFMPYNYLVNPNIRPPSLKISNSIVIFDEAHNIESVCCDSVSFELRAETLAQCISEVQSVLELNKTSEDCLVSAEDLAGLKKVLLNLEQVIENIKLPKASRENAEPSITREGDYIFEILKEAEITMDVKDTIIDVAQDVLRELVTPEAEESASLTMSSAANRSSRSAGKYGLEVFVTAMQTIFGKTFKSESFKVHIAIKKRSKSSSFNLMTSRTLSVWCFNPGVAISSLKKEVHAMILTSGTLSPLQSFSSELQIEFPIRLENDHLIKPAQIYVGVLEKGPCCKELSSAYQIRTTDEYMHEFGNVLVNIARRIPFGMLVFFASYTHMENCVEYWRNHRIGNKSIMAQIEKNKHVISEPRGGGQSAVKQVFAEYTSSLKRDGGAMLLAVMRGKVSEGMDFSDNFARCVVIAGIPYPYMKDPKICAKKQYMNVQYTRAQHTGSSNGGVNGQAWYQQQAVRAVNQAIGRIIRHRFDYGCVILADKRFSFSRNQQDISKWIRPHIKTVKNFGLLTRDLTMFFKQTAKQFDQFQKKPKNDENAAAADRFAFIKVKRELENISSTNAELDVAQALATVNEEEKEHQFKRNVRKRKYSDLQVGNIQKRFLSTPNDSAHKKRRVMKIAYELNDYGSAPSVENTSRNNCNKLDISFHGNTPMASHILKRGRMESSQANGASQSSHKRKKANATKLRLESDHLSQAKYVRNHECNKRKAKRVAVLQMIKNELSATEYQTFKSVLKLLQTMKNSADQRAFDENVVTPFRALFFSTPKRQHFLVDLKKYIPKQFVAYYARKLEQITLTMPVQVHHSLDDSFVKLRKLQNKNADVSVPQNKHKRKKKTVTKSNGFDGLCRSLMRSEDFRKLHRSLKEWKGVKNDAEMTQNKKRILNSIVNIFLETCRDDIKEGHLTKFRSISKAFNNRLTKQQDKKIYHQIIRNTDQIKPHLQTLYQTRMK